MGRIPESVGRQMRAVKRGGAFHRREPSKWVYQPAFFPYIGTP
jgi:hypothetical protein